MKTIVRLTLVAAMLVMCGSAAHAQKFGHVDLQELISLMPEYDSANVKLQALQKELSEQLDQVNVEFNTKLQELQKNQATLSQAVNEMKTKELNDLQTRYQELQQVAQQQFSKEQAAQFNPIYEKAQKAIEKISKENGFTLVFNTVTDPLVYFNAATVIDVLPLVKKDLNLKDKPADAAATTPATPLTPATPAAR